MKPRASASFCHWPNDTSTPPGQVGPSCVSRPGRQPRDDVVGAGALDGRDDRGLVVHARHVADADGVAGAELEAEEVLERAGQARAPLVGRHARERRVVHEDRAGRRLVQLGEQLDQRRLAGAVLADDGDDRAGGQRQRHVVEHEARRARVGERHVLEADAAAHGGGHRHGRPPRRATPRSPRARRGAASRPSRCRAGSRSRRPWRRCTPTGASRRRAPAARRPAARRGPTRRTRPRRRRRRRTPPTPACATPPSPSGRRATGPYQRSHASRRWATSRSPMPSDAHLLARRRGRRDREQVAAEAVGLRAALLGDALDRGPPRRREHGRQREHGEQHERRMDRHEQRDRHAEPQDPPAGGEHRHVHVVEHEHLVAQHREPIEVVGALLVRDGRDRRLQPGDVRFERDRDLVAEAALHARADRAQEPGRRGRDAEADRRR